MGPRDPRRGSLRCGEDHEAVRRGKRTLPNCMIGMRSGQAGAIPCGGARVHSATPAVDRAGVAQGTWQFRPRRSWWRASLRLRGRRVHGADLATITLAFIALGLTAAEPRDFRAADTQSKDHPTARALVHMSDLVSDRTQGRHRMIVYPDGVLGEQEASFEQTRTGGIDINRTNMAPLASFVGKANIFGGIPERRTCHSLGWDVDVCRPCIRGAGRYHALRDWRIHRGHSP